MKRSLTVLRSVVLTLGLLMALGGTAWATDGCPPVTPLNPIDFDGVLVGATSGPVEFTLVCVSPTGCAGLHPVITGPNLIEFSATSSCDVDTVPQGTLCSVVVRFSPLGCGTRRATLTLVFTSGPSKGCPVFTVELSGFGCSFPCAIDATQTGIATNTLSTTGGNQILRELLLAQATGGATRCFHLNCALCLAQTEQARGRTGDQAVIDQILCLLRVLCAPAPLEGV